MTTSTAKNVTDVAIREAILDHYAHTGDPDGVARASALYHDDALLEFPQSGERFRGKANIIGFRSVYPAEVKLTLLRTTGAGACWVNEVLVTYNGANPIYGVSILEWRDGLVAHERIYFGEPFSAPAWRTPWLEGPAHPAHLA